ncbi:hypothetical protein HII31_08953 [Pseudocercospora fuligena]|uniref:DUF6594 domain-containing protein n=1 Tax=Pseudocercospora fuligena TaxID=685502 RepID=A0A8H6RGX3_9PEZI|nr:hypothetical protein HII31_08953 [Pseudocercospora fuligena]
MPVPTKLNPSKNVPKQHADVEQAVQTPAERGLPALAAFLAGDPDSETYIFRKFSVLTARHLVHLQCELLELEQQLKSLDDDLNTKGDLQATLSFRDWDEFIANAEDQSRGEWKLNQLVQKIGHKLEEYRKKLRVKPEVKMS